MVQGLLRLCCDGLERALCRKHGTNTADTACSVLHAAGVDDYRAVRRYVERQLRREPLSSWGTMTTYRSSVIISLGIMMRARSVRRGANQRIALPGGVRPLP